MIVNIGLGLGLQKTLHRPFRQLVMERGCNELVDKLPSCGRFPSYPTFMLPIPLRFVLDRCQQFFRTIEGHRDRLFSRHYEGI